MTIDEFIDALERVTRENGIVWHTDYGAIRMTGDICPIVAVYMSVAQERPVNEILTEQYAGVRLGLSREDIVAIAESSDGEAWDYDELEDPLRIRIGRACGLGG
jgi:hypothetical protein